MKNMDCEEILIQKMALSDGEKTDLPAAEIEAHLAACENCRREAAPAETAVVMLKRQERRAADADLWSAVEKRIGAPSVAILEASRKPFVFVGALLVAYKLVELLAARDWGWALKLAPFVLIVLLFGLLRENPFKINTELIPEK